MPVNFKNSVGPYIVIQATYHVRTVSKIHVDPKLETVFSNKFGFYLHTSIYPHQLFPPYLCSTTLLQLPCH
jgi:hypothetical protein